MADLGLPPMHHSQAGAGPVCEEVVPISNDLATRIVDLRVVVLSALFAHLYRLCGKVKLAVWCIFPNRSQKGTEELIGLFSHMHAVGVEITTDTTNEELQKRVKNSLEQVGRHADVHSSMLWRRLGKVRRLGNAGLLFNVIDETDPEGPASRILQRESLPYIPRFRVSVGLHLFLVRRPSRTWELTAQFSPSRFPAEFVQARLHGIVNTVTEMVETPNALVRVTDV